MQTIKKPTFKLETVTPKMAKEWLEKVKHNRHASEERIVEYALKIDAGEWIENGETIKFNDKGELFDGQHRLHACMLAGKQFSTLVVRGIDDERAFATVDVGKVRTPSDIFALHGFANPAAVAGGARLLYWHEHKLILPSGPKNRTTKAADLVRGTKYSHSLRIQIPSKDELLDYAQNIQRELAEACKVAHNTKTAKLLTPSVAIASYIIFKRKSLEEATRFFSDLGSGASITLGDPVHVLREKIMATRVNGARLNPCTLLFYVFKAWNKRREGVAIKYLRMDDGEGFPPVS